MKNDITSRLAGAGWALDDETYAPRVTLDICGGENVGKSALALSASSLGPLAYMAFDPGWEIVKKFRAMGREIAVKRYSTRIPNDVPSEDWAGVSEAMHPEFERWQADLKQVLEIGVTTVVIDTASEAYELVRLALMGRLNPNVTDDYGRAQGQVNATMRSILKAVEDSGSHLIVLHKVSDFNKDGVVSTRISGWKDITYYAPYRIRCRYDYLNPDTDSNDAPKFFQAEVLKSKFVKELEGRRVRWEQEDGFAALCELMVPNWPTQPKPLKAVKAAGKLSFGKRK